MRMPSAAVGFPSLRRAKLRQFSQDAVADGRAHPRIGDQADAIHAGAVDYLRARYPGETAALRA